jgi:hypothetical protein
MPSEKFARAAKNREHNVQSARSSEYLLPRTLYSAPSAPFAVSFFWIDTITSHWKVRQAAELLCNLGQSSSPRILDSIAFK